MGCLWTLSGWHDKVMIRGVCYWMGSVQYHTHLFSEHYQPKQQNFCFIQMFLRTLSLVYEGVFCPCSVFLPMLPRTVLRWARLTQCASLVINAMLCDYGVQVSSMTH
jgi:hypothetical protein